MIITRTPFRASFAGGGSDVRWFYQENGYGEVLSAALKHYMYIVIHPYFHSKRFRLKYSQTEDISNIDEIQHSIMRSCLQRFQMVGGIEISSFADVPAGTGLGSSSSFTVGLIHALYAWHGKEVTKAQLAKEACEIEIEVLGKPIGKQDQYAAAFGGVRRYRFNNDETVEVESINLSKEIVNKLENNLCLYHVSGTRSADSILKKQNSMDNRFNKAEHIRNLVDMVKPLKEDLNMGRLDAIGSSLHKGWITKKSIVSDISGSEIDKYYDKARNLGALGGKLLGAGGAGFLMLYSHNHELLQKELGLQSLAFKIDYEGSKLLYSDH
jgi:D-glycero-alpha-D-manno-heptose-7-phosphate kinase